MSRRFDQLIVFIAQGFGVGRIPFAPGTWGSLLGLGLFFLLVAMDIPLLILVVPFLGVLIAILLCARASDILGAKDPPSIVLDEIVAMLLCLCPLGLFPVLNKLMGLAIYLATWLGLCGGDTPGPTTGSPIHMGPSPIGYPISYPSLFEILFTNCYSPIFLGFVFVQFLLFRLFDIWKPWPIRQSQRLPGGWGIVMDDVLAAVYVNLVMLAAWWGWDTLS